MKYTLLFTAILVLSACNNDPIEGCFPSEKLPDNIEPLTEFGQRAEWSLDGKDVYFVDKAGGDLFKVNIETKKVEQISTPEMLPEGHGYYRIMCLSNGDFLLTCGPGRRETYFQIWDGDMKEPPYSLDEKINEGPAISRKSMKIAWSEKQENIIIGEIVYNNGTPEIINKDTVIYNDSVVVDGYRFPQDMLEPQSFRPGQEEHLLWAMYGNTEEGIFTSETMLYNIETGEIKNLSNAPGQYDEPEGIFPDGEYTLTECDMHQRKGTGYLELYKLRIDSNGKDYTRLTHFSDVEGFRASNPVVSDDGTMIAFQASISDSEPGEGCGLYLMYLESK